jgi:uncharacterized delta-60 repeat protein
MRYHRSARVLLVAGLLAVPPEVAAAPGDLDASFGTGGTAVIDGGPNVDVRAGLLQPDGKFVVAGRVVASGLSDYDFALARFTAAGSADGAFGAGGVALAGFGGREFATALALQGDGKLVAAGYAIPPSCPASNPEKIAVARFDADGTLDPTFGAGGLVITAPGASSHATGVAIRSDGKIVVTGWSAATYPGLASAILARYQSDGSLDTTFGTGGIVTIGPGAFTGLRQQADGHLLATSPTVAGWSVTRLDGDGVVDVSFGVGGVATVPFGTYTGGPSAIAQQPDGKILLGGSANGVTGFTDFVVARLDADGVLDASFGASGIVTTDLTGNNDYLQSLALQPDGRIVVGGWTNAALGFVVARYDADGALDATFGTGGHVFTGIGAIPDDDYAYVVTVLPDGRIVAGGYADGTKFAAARYVSPTCGNAVVEIGEDCEDGNTENGDCCSAECRFEAAGAACADDAHPCTADRCDGGGVCTHDADVRASCRQVTRPFASSLRIKNRTPDDGDRLVWRWRRGYATTLGELGDPRVDTAYTFCLFDEAGSTPAVLLELAVPAGGACGSRPCWSFDGSRYRYRNPSRLPSGIDAATLVPGPAALAKMTLTAHGPPLHSPALPLSLPVRAQLQSSTGLCWGATFDGGGTTVNGTTAFHARGQQ